MKKQTLMRILLVGIVFIATAAIIVNPPLLRNISTSSNDKGEVFITFDHFNVSEVIVYKYYGEEPSDLCTVPFGGVEIWATTTICFANFEAGLHKLRLVAKNSDGDEKVYDPIYVYVNIFED